jgi:hypothetical protein
MDIQVKDPSTGALLLLEARPERYRGEHGFRIRHPNGSGFLVVNRSGSWRVADDHHIEADFLVNTGWHWKAIRSGNKPGQIRKKASRRMKIRPIRITSPISTMV